MNIKFPSLKPSRLRDECPNRLKEWGLHISFKKTATEVKDSGNAHSEAREEIIVYRRESVNPLKT